MGCFPYNKPETLLLKNVFRIFSWVAPHNHQDGPQIIIEGLFENPILRLFHCSIHPKNLKFKKRVFQTRFTIIGTSFFHMWGLLYNKYETLLLKNVLNFFSWVVPHDPQDGPHFRIPPEIS